MTLPPNARSLYGRTGRAALPAGTPSTVRDHPTPEHEQRLVETSNADGYDPDVVSDGQRLIEAWGMVESVIREVSAPQSRWTEADRQAFLRRVQYVDPRGALS